MSTHLLLSKTSSQVLRLPMLTFGKGSLAQAQVKEGFGEEVMMSGLSWGPRRNSLGKAFFTGHAFVQLLWLENVARLRKPQGKRLHPSKQRNYPSLSYSAESKQTEKAQSLPSPYIRPKKKIIYTKCLITIGWPEECMIRERPSCSKSLLECSFSLCQLDHQDLAGDLLPEAFLI